MPIIYKAHVVFSLIIIFTAPYSGTLGVIQGVTDFVTSSDQKGNLSQFCFKIRGIFNSSRREETQTPMTILSSLTYNI